MTLIPFILILLRHNFVVNLGNIEFDVLKCCRKAIGYPRAPVPHAASILSPDRVVAPSTYERCSIASESATAKFNLIVSC